jgi:hypothetical protein
VQQEGQRLRRIGLLLLREHIALQKPQAGDAAKRGASMSLASFEQSKAAVKGLAARNEVQKTLDVNDGKVVVPCC